jgi:hypothetical protein
MVNRNVSSDKLIEMVGIDLGPEEISLGYLGRYTPCFGSFLRTNFLYKR